MSEQARRFLQYLAAVMDNLAEYREIVCGPYEVEARQLQAPAHATKSLGHIRKRMTQVRL